MSPNNATKLSSKRQEAHIRMNHPKKENVREVIIKNIKQEYPTYIQNGSIPLKEEDPTKGNPKQNMRGALSRVTN